MSDKKEIRPLKSVARGPVAGLLSSYGALVAAARGDTDIAAPKQLAINMPTSFAFTAPMRESPLTAAIEAMAGSLASLLSAYHGVDAAFVIPRAPGGGGGGGGPAGPRSVMGKLVVPSKLAAPKFVELFGSTPRLVTAEGEDEFGELWVQVEGLGAAKLSRERVRLADGAPAPAPANG